MSRAAAAAVSLFAFALPASTNSDGTGLAISAWPARTVVVAPGRATVGVGNPGGEPVQVVARAQGYALDARGRPRIQAPGARWLVVRPERFVVPPHAARSVRVSVRRPNGVRPGDHAQLVLLSTEPPAGGRLVARLRLGVVVDVRVPGKLVHRLAAGAVRVRRGPRWTILELVVANRGNVDEWLGRGRVGVSLVRGGWRLASRPIAARRLLARSSGVIEARFRSAFRGRVDAVVELRQPGGRIVTVRRRYHLRL